MLGKRVPEQVGNRLSTVHGTLPPARMKNVEWVVGTLRNGDQEYVRTIVPGTPPEIINTHNYQAMYYPDGSYAGINEIIFNFKPWLDWYLETTGQRLVGVQETPHLLPMLMQPLALQIQVVPIQLPHRQMPILVHLLTNK